MADFGTPSNPLFASDINMLGGTYLRVILKRFGLESLEAWAKDLIIRDASPEEIELLLYDRPEFKTRFKGIFNRQSKNLPPISPEEYLQYESMAHSLGSTWGIRLTQDEIDNLISWDVSAVELEERFGMATEAVYTEPEETRSELNRLYGITTGQLAKYWMDPTKQFPELQRRFMTGQIAGAGIRTGFGQLNEDQARRLLETGTTGQNAAERLGELTLMKPLFEQLTEQERTIGLNEQVEFLAGDVAIGKEVGQRAERRLAEFQGGGEFAVSEEGFKGTGAATS